MFNSILYFNPFQSFSPIYVQSTQVCSICFGFSQVFTADLPHHAPLGHRCLRLHRRCHHRGGRPCHHRYDLTRRTQRCSRRLVLMSKKRYQNVMFFSWSCFSVEDCKSEKCSCTRLEAIWWLYLRMTIEKSQRFQPFSKQSRLFDSCLMKCIF